MIEPSQIDLVGYHANCFDGFCAAWAAWKHLGDKAEYVPLFHGEKPPDFRGRHVALVDFAYKRPVLDKIATEAASLVVLDHHKDKLKEWCTAPRLEGEPLPRRMRVPIYDNAFIHLDMDHSGARLSWDYFTGAIRTFGLTPRETAESGKIPRTPPLLVDYVEDRDLWRWDLPFSREVSEALKIVPFEFSAYSAFNEQLDVCEPHRDDPHIHVLHRHTPMGELVARGQTLLALTAQHLDLLAQTASKGYLDGIPLWIANAPYVYASELGNVLAQRGKPDVAAVWRYDHMKGRISVSLRSAETSDVDVSAIAVAHGGGGHAHAAGFEIGVTDIGEIFDV